MPAFSASLFRKLLALVSGAAVDRRYDLSGLESGMLMLGFGGLGFATFSVGTKVGQIVEAAWWKGKLQEALASTREPSPLGETSVVRERRELSKSPLRPGSLLRRPSSRRLQARSLRRASEE